jgi:hypothetical protein
MQFILDVIAAAIIWLAAVAFSHFGIKVELPDRDPPKAERTIERTQAPARDGVGRQDIDADPNCPKVKPAVLKRV